MNKFSIEYPEYHIAGLLQDDFKKADNFSVSIPLSRQQKYYDLLLYNANNKKCLTIQVKSSRTYIKTDKIDDLNDYNYYAWLNNFQVSPHSDFYFIFISYPVFNSKIFNSRIDFGSKILVFDNKEITTLLENIKTKKGTPDKFFGFGFNIDDNKVFGTRGFSVKQEFTNNLYETKLEQIKQNIQ